MDRWRILSENLLFDVAGCTIISRKHKFCGCVECNNRQTITWTKLLRYVQKAILSHVQFGSMVRVIRKTTLHAAQEGFKKDILLLLCDMMDKYELLSAKKGNLGLPAADVKHERHVDGRAISRLQCAVELGAKVYTHEQVIT